jgi:TATA-binding protein-associated factor Taf7
MGNYATTRMESMETKIRETADNPVRQHVLETAKGFKSSWIELGRALYSVYKDKLYKEWGFAKFETYTSKEIGIRNQTAMKLLRSYFFLEKEEPGLLKDENEGSTDPSKIPSYESVNVLRLAKNNKSLDNDDYENLKKGVFSEGKDALEVRKDLTSIIRERKELDPEEAREEKRTAVIRRFLSTLKSLKMELETTKMLPASLTKDVSELIKRVEEEMD